MAVPSKQYWEDRTKVLDDIKKSMKDDDLYKKELDKVYNLAKEDIQNDIDGFISRYAKRESLSITEAKKRISENDVKLFASKAEKYVKEKNFSDIANEELKLYNVTMKTNRLELLQSNIHLELTALSNEEEAMLQKKLGEVAIEEYTRQSGILNDSVPTQKQLRAIAKTIAEAEFRETEFSARVWQNQKELQEGLENIIRRGLIQGENPRVGARKIKKAVLKEFKLKKYAADRIAITEMARVQGEVQRKAFDDEGFDRFIWIAEPSACDICKQLDGKNYSLNDSDAPTIPRHPFCKCATSAYMDRQAWDERLKARGL